LFIHLPPGIILLKNNKSPFKWRHFEPTVILLCVRWYCKREGRHILDVSLPSEAFAASQEEKALPFAFSLRRTTYPTNIVEQDHRFIKKKVRASQCFKSFHTAERALKGIEAVNMIRKGQVKRLTGNDAQGQARFVASLFGVAAWRNMLEELSHFGVIFATLPRTFLRAEIASG
jgi:transposase-like protein